MEIHILEVLTEHPAEAKSGSVRRLVRFSSEVGSGTATLVTNSDDRLRLSMLDIEFACRKVTGLRLLRPDEPHVYGLTETAAGDFILVGEITRVPVQASDVIDDWYEASVAGEPLGFTSEDAGNVSLRNGDAVELRVLGLQLYDTGHPFGGAPKA